MHEFMQLVRHDVFKNLKLRSPSCVFIISDVFVIIPPSGRGLVIPVFFIIIIIIIIMLFFFLVTCPKPLVFAPPNKYSSRLLLHRLELVS